MSDEEVAVNPKWTDRTRTMVTLSRGVPARVRHLANDLKNFFPQIHSEPKFDKKDNLLILNEMASLSRCERVMYFETRSGQDFYLWFSTNIANGPSAKFRVLNVHTMSELNFTGNCLKYSRPILSFDPAFEGEPHMQLLKEMLTQMFYVPENHPKSKPYFDHIINFGLTPDRRIWIRFYAIPAGNMDIEVEEIGPRFVLELIRILNGSFEGDVLYNNQEYISPRFHRRQIRQAAAAKSRARAAEKESRALKQSALNKVIRPDSKEIFDEQVLNSKEAKQLLAHIDSKKNKNKKLKKKAGGKTVKA